jgi:hypothetical protein
VSSGATPDRARRVLNMQLPAYATCSLHELLKEGGDGFTMQRFDGESTPHAASGYRPTPPPATSGVNDPTDAIPGGGERTVEKDTRGGAAAASAATAAAAAASAAISAGRGRWPRTNTGWRLGGIELAWWRLG